MNPTTPPKRCRIVLIAPRDATPERVLSALEGGDLPGGFQRVLVEKVTPSLLAARKDGQNDIEDLERRHVREIVNHIIDRSPEIKSRLGDGKVGVVGMRYHLSNGLAEVVVTKGVTEDPLV